MRNGIEGSNKVLLDVRLQYVHRLAGQQTMGFYWEIYNALDREPVAGRR